MEVVRICFQIALVTVPHIGYCVQRAEIHRTQSFAGYSPVVSLILLTSNTLRIYYYIGHRFLLALLFQAIVGVAVHGALLCKILEVQVQHVLDARSEDTYDEDSGAIIETAEAEPPTVAPPSSAAGTGGMAEKQNQTCSDRDDTTPSLNTATTPAAEWPASSSATHNEYEGSGDAPPSLAPSAGIRCGGSKFMRVLFGIEDCIEARLLRNTPPQFVYNYVIASTAALVTALLYYASIRRVWENAAEVVGYTALGIEALLVLPQILRNARRRSTEGLTMLLILTWVCGDIIKVIYFIYAKQALPFIVCGCFQVFLDIVVVAQLVYYRLIVKRESEVLIEGDDSADGQYGDGTVPVVDSLE
ncbi:conserved hypothetical protein [Leishmania mexicana MHOM/GT/2001/U1103]|uniref:PQ loop repeat family protein n=1 Tax=Leishmania mexicana (strain MHOM/GT/2001/U1103) TaxID=929439 RepID=E9AYI4_LEIMU|nr:conserved hypothetical protein [Leishmania mexicana MHOM/GT/2001/U1103]CBZ28026.1 conserved hypothetical protein [Leishmania mexicana MHOM/GT/2001/U1103]